MAGLSVQHFFPLVAGARVRSIRLSGSADHGRDCRRISFRIQVTLLLVYHLSYGILAGHPFVQPFADL